MTTTNVSQIKFNKLSENQYEGITPVDGEFYITPCPTYALDSEAVHKTGNETINGTKTFNDSNVITNKEFISLTSSPYGQFRAIEGNYGFFIRNDGNATYFLLTNSNDQYGSWNSLRPLTIENASGKVRINNSVVSGFVKETWKSGTSWYRVWSDGWIEQGGQTPKTSDALISVSFAKAFSQDNPNVQFTRRFYYDNDITAPQNRTTGVSSVTTTGFKCHDNGWPASGGSVGVWYACGY